MSLQKVKVSKAQVLDIVRENKEKHDQLLKEAIEGYWIAAEEELKKLEKESLATYERAHREQLKKIRKQYKEQVKGLKEQVKKELALVAKRERNGYSYFRKPYPEDHGDDYEGTIRRLELLVDDNVELDTHEFDSYVRNKWDWKDSFLANNLAYANALYSDEAVAATRLGGKAEAVKTRSAILKSGKLGF
jgi:hypothetical protein